jgi:hypothetical protein
MSIRLYNVTYDIVYGVVALKIQCSYNMMMYDTIKVYARWD